MKGYVSQYIEVLLKIEYWIDIEWSKESITIHRVVMLSLLYSNTMFACLYVCMLITYLLQNGWTDLAKLFLLAPSWSRDGFRPKKFRIRDPVYPEIRKNPDFRVLFDQFGWNVWVILTLNQICFNTNKFLDPVSGSPNPESGFSGKIR